MEHKGGIFGYHICDFQFKGGKMKYIIVLVLGLWMLGSTACTDQKPVTDLLLLTQFQGLEIEDLKKEVNALRAEHNQTKEEFKLIKINSGHMVEQMNALTKLVHEINKSPKIAEQQSKTIYVPYRETGDSTDQIMMHNVIQMNDMRMELDDIKKSLRHGR